MCGVFECVLVVVLSTHLYPSRTCFSWYDVGLMCVCVCVCAFSLM